jgi:hypothetical protein
MWTTDKARGSPMRKVIYEIEDDITGEPGAVTVRFTYAGKDMEIDLTPTNRETFDKVMSVYMECGRRVNGKQLKAPRRPRAETPTVPNGGYVDDDEPETIPTRQQPPISRPLETYSRVEVLPSGVTESTAIRNWWATRPERHTKKPLASMGRIPADIKQLWIDNGRPVVRR